MLVCVADALLGLCFTPWLHCCHCLPCLKVPMVLSTESPLDHPVGTESLCSQLEQMLLVSSVHVGVSSNEQDKLRDAGPTAQIPKVQLNLRSDGLISARKRVLMAGWSSADSCLIYASFSKAWSKALTSQSMFACQCHQASVRTSLNGRAYLIAGSFPNTPRHIGSFVIHAVTPCEDRPNMSQCRE